MSKKLESVTSRSSKEQFILPLVRSELNLEKNTVFTVSTYKGKSRTITDIEGKTKITVGKLPDGTEIGVLTINHFKIFLVLTELWEAANKPINEPVHFSLYKIVKRLDLTVNGTNYERIKQWIAELRYIPISFLHCFYESETKKYINLAHTTILSYLDVYENENAKERRTRGYGAFQFDRHILQNLLFNYVHPLRLDIIKSFQRRRDLAILLYTFLDRNLAFKNRYEINLINLFSVLDLSQRHVRFPSERKKVIEPVLEEVKGKPLSTGILIHCKIERTKDGTDYKLVSLKRPFKRLINERKGLSGQKQAQIDTGIPEEEQNALQELFKGKIKDEEWTTLSLDELLKKMKEEEGN